VGLCSVLNRFSIEDIQQLRFRIQRSWLLQALSLYNKKGVASYLLGERILGQVDGLQARLNEGKPDLDAAALLRIKPSVAAGGLIS
jgi:hypothetical protein